MGAVGIDINAKARQLEVMFPMNTTEGIVTFLENINYIESLQYFSGDYDALIMLIDFERAWNESGLTKMEKEVLNLVFLLDRKKVEVAIVYGVTKQTIQKHQERAVLKLANYYKKEEGESSEL